MILIVEDSQDMQLLIRLAFKDEGYEIQVASNGFEALKIIDSGAVPNLIFLDSTMDVMNGADFLKELEVRCWDRKIPVVVMSGLDRPLRSPLIVENLKKPFDIDSLRRLAARYSKQHHNHTPEPTV